MINRRSNELHSPKEKQVAPMAPKTLEELDQDISDETDSLMDPVNGRILVLPMLPWESSKLHSVEFGSLYRQLQSDIRRVNFHPLDQSLPLTEETIRGYYLNVKIIEERDAYLQKNGYTREQWLASRGITPEEYQKLLGFFQKRCRRLGRLADFSLLTLIAAAGIAGYFYGAGAHSLFLSMICADKSVRFYQAFRFAAGMASVLNTLSLNWAWNKRTFNTGLRIIIIALALNWAFLMVENAQLDSVSFRLSEADFQQIFSLALAKWAIPVLQGGVLVAGKSLLRRFSLFYSEPELLKTYADRPSLERKADAA